MLRASAAMMARPQAKLDSSRNAGLDRDGVQVEELGPARPAGGLPDSTA